MAINQQTLERYWNEIRAKLQQRWSELNKEDLQRARASVEQLVTLVQEKTGTSREQVRRYLDELTSNLRSALSSSSQQARELGQSVQQRSQESMREASEAVRAAYIQTGRTVRRHPVESVAIGFATGLLSGIVLSTLLRSR